MLGVTRVVDLIDQANVPLTVDVDMSEVMTFKAGFLITGMSMREGGVNRYAADGSSGTNFVSKFYMLNG